MTDTPQRIAIIGGGLMGAGIAQVFAAAGHRVTVHEPVAEVRETVRARIAANLAALEQDPAPAENVAVAGELAAAVADAQFVFEAAPEKLPLKQSIFAALAKHAPPGAILASNTSVIPITDIVHGLETASRMAGTHWWNPPYLVPLVEVVQTAQTAPQTVAALMALLKAVGKAPVHVKKDVPGFVANRLQHALWREAIAIVAAGICDAETVDTCVKQSFGLRLPVLGPLENADLVGLDLTLDIHNVILPAIDNSPAPSPLLQELVEKGDLGFKTGKGFRAWSAEDMANLRARLTAHLKRALSGSETA
ncbi:MAG: 3-hydroxyacyl-CoA dehydrogenase family protein [Alphaproteobacteria bacterium]|nr:3-hydroxyacyl-CoA dehydrogenase family protein [Alphaproteobacteria bacterium]MDE2011859.1 3-hydroxyacyl-CoA dehydrogenase family protein [Alphaproteobacteria bacterium]MDE2075391.1 3-hydroxyacyl-CoA dehydrogenase family protein [Alphaproteobacteria bacterium]